MPMEKTTTRQMDSYYRATLVVLFSIATLGLIAIPFGNPKFIDRAIILELQSAKVSAAR